MGKKVYFYFFSRMGCPCLGIRLRFVRLPLTLPSPCHVMLPLSTPFLSAPVVISGSAFSAGTTPTTTRL